MTSTDFFLRLFALTGEDLDRLSEQIAGPTRVKGEPDADFRVRMFAHSCLLPIEEELQQ